MEITKTFLRSKGLSSKQIKEYFKNLKNLRKAINPNSDLMSAKESMYELDGGLRFFYQEWRKDLQSSTALPKCILFVFHGAYGSSDMFYPLADYLKSQNIMVIGYDYRGHGRTGGQAGGKLGDITKYSDIIADGIQLITQNWEHFHVPIFLLGYDIGGLIAMHIAHRMKNSFIEGLILISPLWMLEKRWKHIILYPLISIGTLVSKTNNYQTIWDELLEDTYFEEFKEFAQSDPLRLKKMSYRMFKGILDLIRNSHSLTKKINLPCLIFQGTQDQIVNHYAVHRLYKKWPHPNKKIRLYENTGHNLLVDQYAREMQDEILSYLLSLI